MEYASDTGEELAAALAQLESNLARLAAQQEYADLVAEMRELVREIGSALAMSKALMRPPVIRWRLSR